MLLHLARGCGVQQNFFLYVSCRAQYRDLVILNRTREPGAPGLDLRPGKRDSRYAIHAVRELVSFGNQQAQIAQVLAGGAGHHGVAERGEHRTGVEGGQR